MRGTRLIFAVWGLCLLSAPAPVRAASDAIDDVYARLRQGAAEKSPEVRLAEAQLRQKEAQHHTAWARWLPRIELQLSESTSRNYALLTSGQIPAQFANLFNPPQVTLGGWAVNAIVPIYRRSVHLAVRQASGEIALARAQLELRLGELDWRLRGLVGNYLLSAYKVETLANSIEIAKTNRKEAQLRFALGSRTKIDLLRSEANVISLESKRLAFQEGRAADRSALVEYVGMSDAELKETGLDALLGDEARIASAIDRFVALDTLRPKIAALVDEEGADDTARARLAERITKESPSYRAIQSEQATGTAQADSLTAAEWPDLSLQASLHKEARDWGDLVASGNQSYSLGIVLTLPIYLGGSLFSSSREAAEASRAVELRARRDTLKLLNEVDNERLRILSLVRSVEAFRVSLEQNTEIVRLSARSYELGKTTLVEWLGSQNDLIDSKINYAKSRIDLAVLMRRFAANLGVPQP